eukprot:CAMPEP_0178433562 /NCGR_PEP_ID=MMETSP0689_2-20121128/32969_1 /TAXON_ID=160604 /ORGANISM="Amphidinium massartii, Strain CS-259" /LENGTH=465 /DNA_ID=CAMNT_0020055593 /DNA_START=144 /DNA_END=1541 /DNA_ORIENTATION=+
MVINIGGGLEKIYVGVCMSSTWLDPPMLLIAGLLGAPLAILTSGLVLWWVAGFKLVLAWFTIAAISTYLWFSQSYMEDGPAPIDKYIEFKDKATEKAWSGRRIPITLLGDLYLDDKIDFRGDVLEILRDHRNEFCNYKLTWELVNFLVKQLFPNSENSSLKDLKSTKKEIKEHYDRGNDWFFSFLGPRMVYTSAVFEGLDQSLETAQDNKMSLICEKLMVRPGDSFLDIGCGWGSLVCHAAQHYGATAAGVTLSVEGAKYCREQITEKGLDDSAKIIVADYRDIPQELRFKKIASIEMAEHVGLRNFQTYLGRIHEMLTDDGMFLMQVAGLRQGSNWEDLSWGLFMSRYIFPGADASTPLHWYVKQLELAGFEVHSVETIGRHYSHTLHRWYDNFQKNRADIEKKYGGYLCRLWDFFLAWSVVAAGQGTAACYQILVHKNTNSFPRDVFCEKTVAKKSVGMKSSK